VHLPAASGIQYKHTLTKQNYTTVIAGNISISIHSWSHPMGKKRLEKMHTKMNITPSSFLDIYFF
jgi:hypothetical protein